MRNPLVNTLMIKCSCFTEYGGYQGQYSVPPPTFPKSGNGGGGGYGSSPYGGEYTISDRNEEGYTHSGLVNAISGGGGGGGGRDSYSSNRDSMGGGGGMLRGRAPGSYRFSAKDVITRMFFF